MNQPQLPAYLQGLENRRLVDAATAGLGTSLPAHISTQGSVFTLIDAAGNEQRLTFTAQDGRVYQQPFIDACIADINKATSKRYYGGKKWTPGANDAPLCWSANGDVPSNDSSQKQARTCAECKHNERGSAISEKSGASIKACRDEKWLGLLIPQLQMDTIFRFVVTPGSFANWKAYSEMFKNTSVDIAWIITRFEFDPDEPNTIKFTSTGQYIDERTAQAVKQALAAKATDAIVGRDQAVAQIAGPATQQALPEPETKWHVAPGQERPFTPITAPTAQAVVAPAGFAMNATPTQPPASASEPTQARRPGRPAKPKAEVAPAQQSMPLQAPFPVGQPPAGNVPNGPGPAPAATFGIQQGVAPDPALQATLAQIFPGTRQ